MTCLAGELIFQSNDASVIYKLSFGLQLYILTYHHPQLVQHHKPHRFQHSMLVSKLNLNLFGSDCCAHYPFDFQWQWLGMFILTRALEMQIFSLVTSIRFLLAGQIQILHVM